MYNFCLLMRSGEQIFHSGIDFKNLIGIQAFLFCLLVYQKKIVGDLASRVGKEEQKLF